MGKEPIVRSVVRWVHRSNDILSNKKKDVNTKIKSKQSRPVLCMCLNRRLVLTEKLKIKQYNDS